MVAKQPHMHSPALTYYNRFDDNFALLPSFSPDDPGAEPAAQGLASVRTTPGGLVGLIRRQARRDRRRHQNPTSADQS